MTKKTAAAILFHRLQGATMRTISKLFSTEENQLVGCMLVYGAMKELGVDRRIFAEKEAELDSLREEFLEKKTESVAAFFEGNQIEIVTWKTAMDACLDDSGKPPTPRPLGKTPEDAYSIVKSANPSGLDSYEWFESGWYSARYCSEEAE